MVRSRYHQLHLDSDQRKDQDPVVDELQEGRYSHACGAVDFLPLVALYRTYMHPYVVRACTYLYNTLGPCLCVKF